MGTTHFKQVDVTQHDASSSGLKLAGVLVTATAAELNSMDGVTATSTEINKLAGVTAGTLTASKAVVVDSSSKIDVFDPTILKINGTAVGSTASEINTRSDDSAMVDTLSGAGAISVDKSYTALTTTGANALTLAAPTKPAFIKVIKMVTDGGDGTLASTNIVGQSSGSTSITFNDVNDSLVLISDTVSGKWIVLKENGVTAA